MQSPSSFGKRCHACYPKPKGARHGTATRSAVRCGIRIRGAWRGRCPRSAMHCHGGGCSGVEVGVPPSPAISGHLSRLIRQIRPHSFAPLRAPHERAQPQAGEPPELRNRRRFGQVTLLSERAIALTRLSRNHRQLTLRALRPGRIGRIVPLWAGRLRCLGTHADRAGSQTCRRSTGA